MQDVERDRAGLLRRVRSSIFGAAPMVAHQTVKGFIELVESVVVELGRQALLLVHIERHAPLLR